MLRYNRNLGLAADDGCNQQQLESSRSALLFNDFLLEFQSLVSIIVIERGRRKKQKQNNNKDVFLQQLFMLETSTEEVDGSFGQN